MYPLPFAQMFCYNKRVALFFGFAILWKQANVARNCGPLVRV
jgi:hypothetical protein